jgi:PAS domain S-box-containing protein
MSTEFLSLDIVAAAEPRPLRVLLIEDSVDDALLLERHLCKTGFAPQVTRIETAEAMRRELATMQNGGPVWDIILADYTLPRFSAPEALRLLKSTPHDIPFIMMSGAVSEDVAVAAMRAGAHDYVSKENLTRLCPAIERELAEAAGRQRRRATERALQQSEERFHRLVEATPLALLISDMQGLVVYANAAVERLLGFRQQEVESGALTLDRLMPGNDGVALSPEAAIDALVEISQVRAGETLERTCLDHTGATLPVLLGAAILNPEAPPADQQIAAFLVDLREQKRGEEVLRRTEKLAAAGRLAASIAHEINNPLEAITNCIYLLEQCDLPEEPRHYVALVQQELARVSHITTQTLRFYRQSTRPAQTDISELLETVLVLYEARLRDHSIQVVREFQPVPRVTVYDGEIRQVLANLVGNALDAITSGHGGAGGSASSSDSSAGRLLLRLRSCVHWGSDDPCVTITVADTGSGMSAATLRRIYEPFFSTKGVTGTGLGLWVSQEIIDRHHGEMRVRSRQQPPSGTVFRLMLPVEKTPKASVVEGHSLPSLEG